MTGSQAAHIRIERAGEIAILKLDKPPVNAIDLPFVLEAEERVREVEADPEIRAVVVTGAGRCFSAGLDLKTVPDYGPDEQRAMVQALDRLVARLYALPLPTVAAANGHAIAGGFVLLLCCDWRIGADGAARFGLTEVRAGIRFPVATLEVVRAELSPAVARRTMLLGGTEGPREALSSGALDEIVPPERALPRALEIARDLSTVPAEGYAAIKRELRAEAIGRIERGLAGGDPLEAGWISGESREAAGGLIGGGAPRGVPGGIG